MSKKLTHGVGYNSKGKYKVRINGKRTSTYLKWQSMLMRCYSTQRQKKYPTYIGCTVASEWFDFQNFADWLESHAYSGLGYQLDKDILYPHNKIYSPDTCCLIPLELNTLITDCGRARGSYPQGVNFDKALKKYRAQIRVCGKSKHIGYFNYPNEAHLAYKKAKEIHIRNKALEWRDRISSDVFNALMSWKLET